MSASKVFVCYDHENDAQYRAQIEAWRTNYDFIFTAPIPGEIDPRHVVRTKVESTLLINSALYTLVVIGERANAAHRDQTLIGFRNWMNFEIRQTKLHGNKIVAVRLGEGYEEPEELMGAAAAWASTFGKEEVVKALNEA